MAWGDRTITWAYGKAPLQSASDHFIAAKHTRPFKSFEKPQQVSSPPQDQGNPCWEEDLSGNLKALASHKSLPFYPALKTSTDPSGSSDDLVAKGGNLNFYQPFLPAKDFDQAPFRVSQTFQL
ncbi:unnamed protein product [Pleuronectes platessa]|uniref:Uncharacterized protein n=1 Tax=Pleuronectes platessa TaxID=8262 RepID=A0A9N7Y8K4_PLEPL|nr:unnamed protein product [Pleuronectes platessa]